MAFMQKETRYVVMRSGHAEYDPYRVVDTIDEVMQVIGTIDDDCESEWNEFISGDLDLNNSDRSNGTSETVSRFCYKLVV